MNYAEKLVKEVSGEKEGWTAEEFMKTFYPELFNTESVFSSKNHRFREVSGSSEKTLFHFKNPLNELPEVSFKFNYVQDKTKSVFEELGIEVLE